MSDGVPWMVAEQQHLADQVRKLHEEIAEVEASEESEDGLIVATVDMRGRLIDIDIDPRVYRETDSAGLAGSIMEAVRAACERVDEEQLKLAKKLMPGSNDPDPDPATGPVLHALEHRLTPEAMRRR